MKYFGVSLLFFLNMLLAQKAVVTVIVEPAPPARDGVTAVFIAGNKPQLGSWNPSAAAMIKVSGERWIFTATFDAGELLEFKITSGTWEGEALYDSSAAPGNTIISVTKDTTVTLRPLLWKSQLSRSKPKSVIQGEVTFHRQLTGKGLNHARDIVVWLPPSYRRNAAKRYPVVYMHDGQNIFDPSTAFAGYDWRMDEVADSLIRAKAIEEIIIVGVNNSADRLPEYSDSPLGDAYLNFVVNVVKPLIDSSYRTKPDRKHTAVMGSSLGGLCSFLFAWKRPDIFGNAGCISSSFWYDDAKTLNEVRNDAGRKKNIRLYLDCGGKEKELIAGYRSMIGILRKKRFVKGKDLQYYFDPNGIHNEHSWSRRVWRPLVFFFGGKIK